MEKKKFAGRKDVDCNLKNEIATGVEQMKNLMKSYPPLLGIDTKRLVDEGREKLCDRKKK